MVAKQTCLNIKSILVKKSQCQQNKFQNVVVNTKREIHTNTKIIIKIIT